MTNNKSTLAGKMTQYRWVICAMLFFATTVNYLDRQVLSLTWDEFIKPEFHWNEYHYGLITSIFSIVYAVCMLFAGRFIDWMGTKKGYLWAIGVWSMGACMHALCGIATEAWVGLPDAAALRAVEAGSALAATIAMPRSSREKRLRLRIGNATPTVPPPVFSRTSFAIWSSVA